MSPSDMTLVSNAVGSLEPNAKRASVQYCSYRAGCGSPQAPA